MGQTPTRFQLGSLGIALPASVACAAFASAQVLVLGVAAGNGEGARRKAASS
jgi:hypothetical protein